TSADLIGASEQVFIQKSQLGGGSPMIRGFAANSILLVVDGVRMNNAIYRSGNLQNIISIDPNIIENTEIIFGPGSVIYGSDALGGVMDFHTKKASLSTSDILEVSTNVLTRYSTANKEKTFHVDFNIGTQKFASLSSVSYSSFDDLKMGSVGNDEYQRNEYVISQNNNDIVIKNTDPDKQIFSGYKQLNIMEKIRYRPDKNLDIDYTFHYSRLSDVPRYDRLIQYSGEKLKYGDWYYGPQKWMMNSFNLIQKNKGRLYDQYSLVAAWQKYEESRHDRKFGKDEIRDRTEKVDIVSLNLDFDKELNAGNSFYYGVEMVYNHVKSIGETRNLVSRIIQPSESRYPDLGTNYYTFSAYSSYKYKITQKLNLITGLRLSHIRLHSEFSDDFYDFPFKIIDINPTALSGSFGFAHNPDSTLQLNLNFSTGFRAPNLDDAGKIFDSEPGNVIVPNENLKPEYAYNFEFGVSKQIRDRFQFEVRAFYTILDNAMVRRDFLFNGLDSIIYDGELSNVEAIVNTDNAIIYGGAASFKSEIFSWFSFNTNINYTHGQDKEGLPLSHVVPLFGSTHLVFKLKKFKADLNSQYCGSINYVNLAPSERAKTHMYATDINGNPWSPSWWTMNMKLSYQMNPHIQLNAGIENIFDKRYRPYSSGICASGRNIYITLRGRF
ncbi:TonB-dependent receptor plug domain-containing protein, partial [Bacteroidota bacterium]